MSHYEMSTARVLSFTVYKTSQPSAIVAWDIMLWNIGNKPAMESWTARKSELQVFVDFIHSLIDGLSGSQYDW